MKYHLTNQYRITCIVPDDHGKGMLAMCATTMCIVT